MRKDPAWRVSASPGVVLPRRLFAVVAVTTLGLALSQRTEGYYPLFEWIYPDDPFFPSSSPPTWDPELWGPGSTLNILLSDDPLWYEKGPFEDYDDLHNFITEYALRPWAEIQTADIRWRLERTTAPILKPLTIPLSIEPHDEDHARSSAAIALRVAGSKIDSCAVRLFVAHGRGLEHWKYLFVHELGHCLGLDHPPQYTVPSYPLPGSYEVNVWDQLPEWRRDPVMAYGRIFEPGPQTDLIFVGLGLDDRIGASWLRPRPGWLEETGEIQGVVTYEDGSPASVFALFAVRRDEYGRMREPLTTLVRQNGAFAMGGVPPGDYFLLIAGAESDDGAWSSNGSHNWEFVRINPRLFLRPVRVEAGKRTRPVFLTVRRRHDS